MSDAANFGRKWCDYTRNCLYHQFYMKLISHAFFYGVQSKCAQESILRKRADRRRGFLAFEKGSLRFSHKEVSLAKSRE